MLIIISCRWPAVLALRFVVSGGTRSQSWPVPVLGTAVANGPLLFPVENSHPPSFGNCEFVLFD